MASLEEVINQTSEEDYLHDPIQFVIDSDLRIVTIPDEGVVAGVVGDKNVNRINFQMNRYYNGFDMSKFTTRINYVNADGTLNYYLVTDLTVENELIFFTWLVDSDVVMYSGTVMFAVNMIIADSEGKIVQSFNTSDKGQLRVLDGIQVGEYITPEEQADILSRLESDVSAYTKTCVTNAEKEVMNYAQNEAVDFMNQSAKTILSRLESDVSAYTKTCVTNAEKEVMNYAQNEAVDSMNQSAENITNENITKIQNEGTSERQKISQKGTEMLADLKRKLYFTDESSGKTYIGELKIKDNKPVLEYEEST